jgi:TrpR family trp operon transcriptional repressor
MQAEDLWALVEEFEKADSKEKLENLLKGLLTPKEIQELAERFRIVRLLKQGVGQHEIAKKLGIGVATVTRGSKEIKIGNFKYVQ